MYQPVPPSTDPVTPGTNWNRLLLTQYHHISTSTTPYWPSTTKYQPVPTYTVVAWGLQTSAQFTPGLISMGPTFSMWRNHILVLLVGNKVIQKAKCLMSWISNKIYKKNWCCMAPNQSIALFVAKNSHTWPKIVCCPLCDNHFNCWTHHNISLVRAISAQESFFF